MDGYSAKYLIFGRLSKSLPGHLFQQQGRISGPSLDVVSFASQTFNEIIIPLHPYFYRISSPVFLIFSFINYYVKIQYILKSRYKCTYRRQTSHPACTCRDGTPICPQHQLKLSIFGAELSINENVKYIKDELMMKTWTNNAAKVSVCTCADDGSKDIKVKEYKSKLVE